MGRQVLRAHPNTDVLVRQQEPREAFGTLWQRFFLSARAALPGGRTQVRRQSSSGPAECEPVEPTVAVLQVGTGKRSMMSPPRSSVVRIPAAGCGILRKHSYVKRRRRTLCGPRYRVQGNRCRRRVGRAPKSHTTNPFAKRRPGVNDLLPYCEEGPRARVQQRWASLSRTPMK